MQNFSWNTVAGWLLAAAISVLGLSIVTGIIFAPHNPETAAYAVPGVEAEASAEGPAKEAEKPIEFYLASASPEKGAAVFKKCAACHTVTPGGAAGIGPNLYGIVGASHAHMAGFGYSDAMAGTKGKVWDWQSLSQWLANPKAYMPGNKMAFAGISKPEDRAAVIAYLNTMSAKPMPMPAVPAEAPAADAEAAPAADAAAAPADAAAAPAADAAAAPAAAEAAPAAH